MSEDTKLQQLIINTLSPEQMPAVLSDTEIYLVEDNAEYATVEELATKQDTLVSGTNIKTIDGESIIGSGDIGIKTIDGESIIGSGDIGIKTINGESIVGSGDIEIKTINGESIIGSGDIGIASGGGGLEIGDIGTALYIDETKGLRRYLNGSIVAINSNTQGFLNWLKGVVTLYPSLATTEENWQAEIALSKLGQCGKFVIDETAGTIRLPRVINIQGLVDLSNAGVTTPESLPNITGAFGYDATGRIIRNGAFYLTNTTVYYSGDSTYGGQGTYDFDASRSSSTYQNSAPVQQEAIQYPYFIQIATGQETEVDIVNEIELNNPFSLFDSRYSDHELNNLSWLRSNGQYHSGTVYVDAYNLLLRLYNGTETIEGISVKAVGDSTRTDYDFVIDTANTQFKLPIKSKTSFVVEEGEQDGISYRIWNDGYCEQWGYMQSSGSSSYNAVTINFIKHFNDTNYIFFKTTACKNNNATATYADSNYAYGTKTISSISCGQNTTAISDGFDWKASGYLAEGQYSNISYLYYYVGETVQNANLINAGRIQEQLADKEDINTWVYWQVDTEGYRYNRRNGYCEQWGMVSTVTGGSQTVNLLKTFRDTNYIVTTTIKDATNSSGALTAKSESVKDFTTSSFTIYCDAMTVNRMWVARGYLASGQY